MKKMMMAVGFAAMIAATAGCQLCDEPKPEVYSRSFVGMDKATVMFEWAKAWQAWPKMSGLPWPVFVIDGKTNQGMPLQLLDGNDDAAIRKSIAKALSGGVFKDAQSMESFMIRLADWNPIDFKWKEKRLGVWFDENGIVTNQCETVRTEYDAL